MITDLTTCIRRCLAWMLLFTVTPALAVICKSVDEQGVVSYSDTPRSECEHPLKLPAYSHYAPSPINGSAYTGISQPHKQGPGDSAFGGYTDLQIVEPKHQGVIHNQKGQVDVRVVLQPDLQPGHRIQVILDGRNLGIPVASTALTLQGVDRGTHSLSAQVLDENDKILRSVGPIRFTLHSKKTVPSAASPGTQGDEVFKPGYHPKKEQYKAFNPETGQSKNFEPGELDPANLKDGTYAPEHSPNGFNTSPDTYSPVYSTKTQGSNPSFTPHYNQKSLNP